MKFIKRNIQRNQKRNKDLVLGSAITSSTITSSISGGGQSQTQGEYLPATDNGDGSYTVSLDKVRFSGSIIANGEVTAHTRLSSGDNQVLIALADLNKKIETMQQEINNLKNK